MTFPWMQSKYTDKPIVCAICGQWIGVGEPRRYNRQSMVSAHDDCVGAREMHDHYNHPREDPSRPVAYPESPKESPERESREAAIERMHAENVAAYTATTDAIRTLKASFVELNMLVSVFVEAYAKRGAGE